MQPSVGGGTAKPGQTERGQTARPPQRAADNLGAGSIPAMMERLERSIGERVERIIAERLGRIERLAEKSVVKDGYTVEEAAKRVNRQPFTVRQWCNKGQVQANKVHGRGRKGEWRISHEELVRIQKEGPRPPGTFDNGGRGKPHAVRTTS